MDVQTLMRNPMVMGLAFGFGAYMAIEYMKPSLIYKDDKATLQNDLLSPLSLGAIVALAVGMYVNRQDGGSGGLLSASQFT